MQRISPNYSKEIQILDIILNHRNADKIMKFVSDNSRSGIPAAKALKELSSSKRKILVELIKQ